MSAALIVVTAAAILSSSCQITVVIVLKGWPSMARPMLEGIVDPAVSCTCLEPMSTTPRLPGCTNRLQDFILATDYCYLAIRIA